MNTAVSDVREKIFEEGYAMLNPEQKRAVDTLEGPVLVNAGPGTGKTQILTLRIANILRVQGADMAGHILALTFTNAGVRAMRQRLAGIIGSEAYRVHIFTFHAFAEHIISQYADYFGDLLEAQAITDVERLEYVEELITRGDYKLLRPFGAPDYYVKIALGAIDKLKRDNYSPGSFVQWNEAYKKELLDSEDSYYKRNTQKNKKGDLRPDALKKYEKNKELAELFAAYENKLVDCKRYDYNDMIIRVIEAIENNQDLAYDLQEQFQYILVDEHQDTNTAQNTIVALLTNAAHLEGRPNLFTVGDDKQAIYRFQGASLENFLSFENSFRDVCRIDLTHNYRSGQALLDGAHQLISNDSLDREHQELQAQKEEGSLEIHEFLTYTDELHWIAQKIKEEQKNGIKLRDIAILYRENKHTDEIQKVFAQYGISSLVLARENILNTAIVSQMLLLLGVVHDLGDNNKLAQLLYSDLFETDTYDVIKIIERFRRNKRDKTSGKKHLYKIIRDKKILQDIGVENPDLFISIAQTLNYAASSFASNNFLHAFDELLEQTPALRRILGDENSLNHLRYFDRLYQEIRSLSETTNRLTLQEVISHFETLDNYGLGLDSAANTEQDGVRLLTAHKSKGLEFPLVFVTNVVDKVWGNKTSREQFTLPVGDVRGDDDDERRLLYVSITRAQEQCYLTYARGTHDKNTEPSALLFDLDQAVYPLQVHSQSIPLAAKYKAVDPKAYERNILDDEALIAIYESRSLSVTALNNYMQCPARYLFNNLLQVPSSYSRTLIYGSLIHAALEQFFRLSAKDKEIKNEQVLTDFFLEALNKEFLPEQDEQEIKEKGLEALSGYYQLYHQGWTVHIETELRIHGIELSLANGNSVLLNGAIDKMEELEAGKVRVIDYKTGKVYSQKTKDEKAALERQLVFYSLLLAQYRGGKYQMKEAVLDFVEPKKETGEYEQHSLTVNQEMKQTLIDDITHMDKEIRSGANFLSKRCGKNNCEACTLLAQLAITKI